MSTAMQMISLVLPLLLVRGISAGGLDAADRSSKSLTYTTRADGEQLELNFERHVWNELLFLWPSDMERQSGEETLVVVSRKVLSRTEFLESLDAWKVRRYDFRYLRLSCSSERTGLSESTCICSSYVRSSNITGGNTRPTLSS